MITSTSIALADGYWCTNSDTVFYYAASADLHTDGLQKKIHSELGLMLLIYQWKTTEVGQTFVISQFSTVCGFGLVACVCSGNLIVEQ